MIEMLGAALAVIVSLLTHDLVRNIDATCYWLIRLAVRQLPKNKQARYEEEWKADVDETPAVTLKILTALGFIAAAFRIKAASFSAGKKISRKEASMENQATQELTKRIVELETLAKPMVSNARQAINYCRSRMTHESVEHLRILYLNRRNRLISDEVFHGGGASSVSVNPRQIVKRSIVLDAQSIIMAHNHPSGDPSPSTADVEVTRDVKRAAEAVDIRLLDHLIIGRSGSISLRTLGYLDGQ